MGLPKVHTIIQGFILLKDEIAHSEYKGYRMPGGLIWQQQHIDIGQYNPSFQLTYYLVKAYLSYAKQIKNLKLSDIVR